MFQEKLPGVFNKYLISSWKTWCYQFPPSAYEAKKKNRCHPPVPTLVAASDVLLLLHQLANSEFDSKPECIFWCWRLDGLWIKFRFKKQRELNQTGASLPFFDLHRARFARYYNLLQVFVGKQFSNGSFPFDGYINASFFDRQVLSQADWFPQSCSSQLCQFNLKQIH